MAVDGTSELSQVFENPNYVTFTYAGHELKAGYYYDSAKYSKVNDGKSLRFTTVTMKVPLPDADGRFVKMTADINQTFTFASGVDTPEMKAARALANEYAAATTSDAITALGASSGGAVSITADFTGIAGLASGASISISNVKIYGDPSETGNGTSCAAISGASIASGDALTVNPATVNKDSAKTVTLTLPNQDQVIADDIENDDTLVIDFTLTVSCTVDGQSADPVVFTCRASYTWDTDKWSITGGTITHTP